MPGAHPRPVPRLVAATTLLAATVLSGCGSSVEVNPPPRGDSPACERVAKRWPTEVSNQQSVTTSPQAPAVHAWGDPAVIARCGVTSPGPTTEQCFDVSGVDWVATKLSDGYKFVTFGREPAIEVLVPSDYSPEPLVLGAFAKAAKAIPQGPRHCT